MGLFENKIALITGSGRGIGRAIALHFARNGADVVVNFFRNRAPAEETVAEIQALGRRAWAMRADVGDLDDLARLFDEIESQCGGLDIFVHNAASGYNRPAMEQKPKGWDWTMNINARSLLFAAQRAVPLMEKRGGGYIVSIYQPGSSPCAARLRGGRRQQGRPRSSHPLPGGGAGSQEHRRQRRLAGHGANGGAAALRYPERPRTDRPIRRTPPPPGGWSPPRMWPTWWHSCAPRLPA